MLKTVMSRSAIIAFACSLSLSAHAMADGTKRAIHIPSGELAVALELLAKQSGTDLVYRPDQVEGFKIGGVDGELSTEEAVSRLLKGTPLTLSTDSTGAMLIALPTSPLPNEAPQASANAPESKSFWSHVRLAQADTPSPSQVDAKNPSPSKGKGQGEDEKEAQSQKRIEVEVVVVGTRIKGARPTSPVVTITQEEMRLSGQNNLGEAIRALPQNFAGGQNPGIGFGSTSNSANFTGSSSLNLRGLGADATLTLLNGARLPYDGIIQATDVSVIPTAAIERVEILLDGASALYGSDAVGGVANVVLKRDYEGAEISLRYGKATDGGFEQNQYTAVTGHHWGSGGFLITGDISRNSNVRAGQRDYLSAFPQQNITIYPSSTQKGALISGHQSLGDVAELTLDAFYTNRDAADLGLTSIIFFDAERDSVIWGVAPALTFTLPSDWSLKLHGSFGENDNKSRQRAFTTAGVELALISPVTQFLNKAQAAGVEFEGPIFDLPGGEARLSFGGGYRRASFEETHVIAGVTVVEGEAKSHNAYGEINLPLISDEQAIPFVSRFMVNGALRYESHETFGDVTTPKIGVIWGVTPGFDLKASWGRSFKAPTVRQQFEAKSLFLFPSLFIPGLPAATTFLSASGGNSALDPERAEVMTAGFVAEPEFLPGFSLEFGWFDIDYTDRVLQPITSLALVLDPAFAAFVTLNPSVAQQNDFFAALGFPVGTFSSNLSEAPYNPANVSAILNGVLANATATHARGVDVIARYSADAFGGRLSLTGNGSWINATRLLTPAAPEIEASGVVFFPASFKGRFGANWSRDGLTLAGYVNHISGVKNTLVTPNVQGDPITTIDLVFDYQMETGPLGGIGLNVAATNLFNEAPPLRQADQVFYLPYDSTNYSAIGRVINITLTKRF